MTRSSLALAEIFFSFFCEKEARTCIVSGFGPTNTMPSSPHRLANVAFSDRNPYLRIGTSSTASTAACSTRLPTTLQLPCLGRHDSQSDILVTKVGMQAFAGHQKDTACWIPLFCGKPTCYDVNTHNVTHIILSGIFKISCNACLYLIVISPSRSRVSPSAVCLLDV